ncbi:MAG TPA: Asp-tRNA(Asn)/Glu-tRNA(Gln) amidotransferase subunit GatA [Anaerolineales bacterium]|nr:Asp-tRNA(Asn)/Glu-tRNA(Gln) amidotransferase subunit GatA [Anaerolineales bacterium]
MSDYFDLPIKQISHCLRSGDFSSRELTQSYLARIESLEKDIHAFITLTPELALQQADLADRQFVKWRKTQDGSIPALLGIPIAVKDVLCVGGLRCTCGSRILEDFVPPFNATAIERLLQAGMVILGKTNTDEFAMGSSTENSAYGVTHNPWDLDRVPGGSSGGSAAAVAARMTPLALGTDTGGSVRQPASFCGVSGLKPTYGRVSRYGLVSYGSSLDVIGVFASRIEDIKQVFESIAGRDPLDSTTVDLPLPECDLESWSTTRLKGLRLGVPEEYFIGGIQPDVMQTVQSAIAFYESLGVKVQTVQLPHTTYALPVYYLVAPAEASANLARFDGIRYGPREAGETLWEIFQRTRGERFGAEVKRRIMLGTYALSAGYYDAYYGQAQKVRTLIKQDFEEAFKQVDLIAAPVAPTTAFRIGEHLNDPLAMYLEDIFTLPANLAGVPGLSFPVGFDQQGLPIGMQLMAPHFREDLLFGVAHVYQQLTEWHQRKPQL